MSKLRRAIGRLDAREVESLDRDLHVLDDFLDRAAGVVVAESGPQDGVPRRDLVKSRDQGLLVEVPANGAHDLLDVDSRGVAE